jgi:hypothetical protein
MTSAVIGTARPVQEAIRRDSPVTLLIVMT